MYTWWIEAQSTRIKMGKENLSWVFVTRHNSTSLLNFRDLIVQDLESIALINVLSKRETAMILLLVQADLMREMYSGISPNSGF